MLAAEAIAELPLARLLNCLVNVRSCEMDCSSYTMFILTERYRVIRNESQEFVTAS